MTLAMVSRDPERQRARRIDAGTVRQTARDTVVLHWLAQMYGMPLDLLQVAMRIGRPRAYQLVQRWKKAGWIDTATVDAGPMWLFPRKHVVEQYLEWSPAHWVPKATTAAHTRAVAAVRLFEAQQHGLAAPGEAFELEHWRSERQLAHEQGYARKGQERQHVPDGVLLLPGGEKVLVEVELTAKSIERYREKLTQIRIRADQLGCAHVAYYCKPGEVHKVVDRQISQRNQERERVMKEQRVGVATGATPGPQWHVRSLEGVPGWKFDPASGTPSEGR